MSTRPERPAQAPSAYRDGPTSVTPSPGIPRPKSGALATAASALSECVGAISLIEVTVHSLESQEIASPEQNVLNQALRALWSVHDWIYDRSWPDSAAESDADRECQP